MKLLNILSIHCLLSHLRILTFFCVSVVCVFADIRIETRMSPPEWALLERELLRANVEACEAFYEKYFDERGWLLCVERWGGDDGPDDAIESCNNWPHLHAIGGSDRIYELYRKAWEGHLRQYTNAKTTEVPFARDGMYYKEFVVMFDWQHNAEGLQVFNLMGLSDPYDPDFQKRVRRYAGFYMNEDPGAPNYDPEHKIIRSMFNGSRGPLMRKATALDWTGDPIDVKNRFKLGHGEDSYEMMLEHFKDYTETTGDHPLNLLTTTLALNAFILSGDSKYRDWMLEYVEAWRQRMERNNWIIPSNIGLDGTIGGEAGGRWYGGTYGWNFTPTNPVDGKIVTRNRVHRSFLAFMNAYLLTADDRFLDAWRRQADEINAQGKMIDGEFRTPRMYGDDGWFYFSKGRFEENMLELYYLSMKAEDRERVGNDGWLEYLEGENPDYPLKQLRGDIERIRGRMAGMRADTTTPDSRLADDPMDYNPASVDSLIRLMEGGLPIRNLAAPLFCRLRYFDSERRGPGIPEDVAALVEEMTDDSVTVTLVNINQSQARMVVIQAGAYAEHRFTEVEVNGSRIHIDDDVVKVRLAPGSGARLVLGMERFVNQPTFDFPWDRD